MNYIPETIPVEDVDKVFNAVCALIVEKQGNARISICQELTKKARLGHFKINLCLDQMPCFSITKDPVKDNNVADRVFKINSKYKRLRGLVDEHIATGNHWEDLKHTDFIPLVY